MRSTILFLSLLCFLPASALCQDQDAPKKKDGEKKAEAKKDTPKKAPRVPGKLDKAFTVDWTSIHDIEALVAALHSNGYWSPIENQGAQKLGFAGFGERLPINIDKELRFTANNNTLRREKTYFREYHKAYQSLHEDLLNQARALILKHKLLPKVKDLNDKKLKWLKKYLKKYKPRKRLKLSKKASPEEKERVFVIAELSQVLAAVWRQKKAIDKGVKESDKTIDREFAQRQKVLKKVLKRYQIKPVAYATSNGSAVCDVHLAPTVIAPLRLALGAMKMNAVQTEDGDDVRLNDKSHLYVVQEYGLPDVGKVMASVTHEFFIARYLERTNDVSKELFRIIGVRLLRGRVWFLIYDNRVIMKTETGFPL